MKNLIYVIICSMFLFAACEEDDDNGGQMMPESAMFTVTIENVVEGKPFFQNGVFNTPVGASEPGPALPGSGSDDGGVYEFSFHAGPAVLPGTQTKLSFATMFVVSNDLFFAPLGTGISLYNENGDAISGDITDQVFLWDAGTEVNEEPGGDNQAPNQSGPDTGPDENGVVLLLDEVNDTQDGLVVPDVTAAYPLVADAIEVTISNDGTLFTVQIKNTSGSSALPSPLAPGVFVVHTEDDPLFTVDEADRGEGLEGVAEDGNAGPLEEYLAENTGLIVPLSPGVWAVHDQNTMPLFTSGEADRGEGLEAIAEDGNPTSMASALAANSGVSDSDAFNTPVGASGPGPIGPGGSYEFTFTAEEGSYLSLTTMFVQSNDLIYTFEDSGMALFNNGTPVSGDVTSSVLLYDAGTEINQFPGAGLDQVIRQSGADTGADDADNTVRMLTADGETEASDGYVYPATSGVIKVTISAQSN